jgi:hypothetical protein
MKTLTRRLFFTGSAAAAVWAGHTGLQPVIPPVPERVKPVNEQVAFLKLVSADHHYLGLGDTNHKIHLLRSFAFNPYFLEAYARTGKKNFLMELSKEEDALLSPAYAHEKFDKECQANLVGDYACIPKQKKEYCDALAAAIQSEPGLQFKGSDARYLVNLFKKLSMGDSIVMKPYLLGVRLQRTVYGCYDPDAPLLKAYEQVISGAFKRFVDILTDDRQTVDGIKNLSDPSVILFGAGHFVQVKDGDSQYAMHTLLRQHKKTAIVNIYLDEAQKAKFEKMIGTRNTADAGVYIIPPANNPSGIEIYHPDFETYKQAALKMAASTPQTLAP